MPKKRNNAWSRRKGQKQIIMTRLIEISMIVDEFVYNRKPISNTEAEQFIKEVESYKTTCIRDERSLQVIEKLTRCMKAIILRHEEADDDSMDGDLCSLGDNRQASVSPVYSISDDDRTQFSQTFDAPGYIADVNKCDEIINLCVDDADDNSSNTAPEDIIRPCPVTVEVDIHRGVSNLSLQDVCISEEPDTCSQSILNNFDDQMQQKSKNTPAKTISYSSKANDDNKGKRNGKNQLPVIATNKTDKVLPPPLIIRASKLFKPVSSNSTVLKNNNSKSLGDTISKRQQDPRIFKTNNYNAPNEQANVFHPVPIKVVGQQERTVQKTNDTNAVNKSQENSQPKYLNRTSNSTAEVAHSNNTNIDNFKTNNCGQQDSNTVPTKKTNQIVGKGKQIKNTSGIPVKNVETKKKRAPRKKKNVETKENKTKNSPVTKKSNRKSIIPTSDPPTNNFNYLANTNPKIPIYNDRVINDLSWMENIRFVREIRFDENDQTLNLEESFWDNYHLPANWNDSEFL